MLSSDDTQREARFKELELENERNKQTLTARIQQLQNEIDLLVKEKKSSNSSYIIFPWINFYFEYYLDILSPDREVNEIISKPQSKTRQVPSTISQTSLPTNDPSPPPPPPPSSALVPVPPSNSEKPSASTSGGIRRPTIIPTPSKNGNNSIAKPGVIPASVPTRVQQTTSMTNSTSSVSELPLSPVPTATKRNVIPPRSISTVPQSNVTSNLRSSPSNNQTSSNMTTSSSTTGNNVTRGGIPRLTKGSNQIVKPSTTTTAPAKRPGQVN